MDDEDPCSLEDLPQRLPMLFFFYIIVVVCRLLVWFSERVEE